MSGIPRISPTPNWPIPAKGDILISTDVGEIKCGTIVRHSASGDVGDVEWAGRRPSARMRGMSDVYLKVNVWRLGASRLWFGHQVEILGGEDDCTGTGAPS